jgi:general secretion pathway protein G
MLSLLLASLIAPALVRPPPRGALQETAPKVQAQSGAAADDEFARLVPKDACIVVRARSLQSVYDSVREVMQSVDKNTDIGTIQSLIQRLDGGVNVAQIALDRPVGLALTITPGEESPALTLIVPALDAQALSESIELPEPTTRRVIGLGQYVVVTDAPTYVHDGAAPAIATGLAPGDIAVRVDLAKLIAMFGPMIEQTLDSAEQSLASGAAKHSGPIDVTAILERYIAWARILVHSAEMLDIAAANNSGTLSFTGALTCRAGSEMATWLGGTKLDIARESRLLDPNASMQYVVAGDLPKLCASMTSLLAAFADQAPEDMRDALGDTLTSFEALSKQLGSGFAINGEWTADGLRGCAYVQAPDPAALLASYLKLLDHDVLARSGLQIRIGPDVELAGAKWKSVHVQFDAQTWAKLAAGAGESDPDDQHAEQTPEPDVHALQEAIDHMYGAQGLQLLLTAKGDQLVVLFGGDEAGAKAALARVEAKAVVLEPALAAALARVDKSNGALVVRFDYGVIVQQMLGVMRGVGGSPTMLDALAGVHLPMTSWAAVDGRIWRAGLALQIGDVAKFVRAIEESIASESRRSQVQADIMMLCAAIDEYTIMNGGLAPESLEVLVVPDANGRTYLRNRPTLPRDPWKHAYLYEKPSAERDYRVYTLGRDGKPGGNGEDVDVDNATIVRHR